MSRKNQKIVVRNLRGFGYLALPSNTSAVGAAVIDRYEIDTTLNGVWTQLGSLFQQWRIKNLEFRFVRIQGSSTVGAMAMAILEDPDSSSPTSIVDVVNCRVAKMWTYSNAEEYTSLRYVPQGRGASWLYTKDNVTNDDRLEMPGDLILMSSNFTSSVSPGLLYMHYEVEFMGLTNSVVALSSRINQPQKESQPDLKRQVLCVKRNNSTVLEEEDDQTIIDIDGESFTRLNSTGIGTRRPDLRGGAGLTTRRQ